MHTYIYICTYREDTLALVGSIPYDQSRQRLLHMDFGHLGGADNVAATWL